MSIEVLAESLKFPEGPIVLPDGSVILVEIDGGSLTRVWKGRREVIAHLGGGPNGAAIGPDGAIYVCNNGGGITRGAGKVERGRIERVDISTGKFERVYETIGEHFLSAPNDLVFDRDGGFWFTDLAKSYERTRDLSGVYYAKPDGSRITEISYGGTGYNGIGLSPDEKTVFVAETYTGRLVAFDLAGPGAVVKGGRGGRHVAGFAERRALDSMAVQQNGKICVGAINFGKEFGGILTVTPDGASSTLTGFDDQMVTNICFGGEDMRDAYITLSNTGRLVKTRWPEPGLKLNYNPYPTM
ncbi:MAG: SMP-30/gluconolactonase/LRE family protein [Caulobacterales bacterium]